MKFFSLFFAKVTKLFMLEEYGTENEGCIALMKFMHCVADATFGCNQDWNKIRLEKKGVLIATKTKIQGIPQ